MRFSINRAAALAALLLSLTACAASTGPIGEWANPDVRGNPAQRILVVAAIERSTRRRALEDYLVDALKTTGAEATPSYGLLTASLTLSRAELSESITRRGLDAVLIVRLAPVDPGKAYEPPVARDLFDYHDRAFDDAVAASRRAPTTIETSLFDARTGGLDWTMQSAVMEPSQPRDFIQLQFAFVAQRLQQAGLVGAVSD